LHLFTNDEMDGLYQAIGASLKREYSNMIVDAKKFFNMRVRKNLHICIALASTSETLQRIIKDHPNIISKCQIYWIVDWTETYLLNEAKHFMKDRLDTEELRLKVAQCMSDIHSFMINECRQIAHAGDMSKEITVQQTRSSEKRRENKDREPSPPKLAANNLPNWPYSKNMLQELIKLLVFF
jgi:dynein heavy chain, axonemal